MKDYQTLWKAVAAAQISDLATVPQKRELFAKLAAHLNTLGPRWSAQWPQ